MDLRTGEIHELSNDEEALEELRKQLEAQEGDVVPVKRKLTPYERRTKKVSRNAPCICGSGKKFKRCCWKGQNSSCGWAE